MYYPTSKQHGGKKMKAFRLRVLFRLSAATAAWSMIIPLALSLLTLFSASQTQTVSASDNATPRAHSILPAYGYPSQEVDFTVRGINLPVGEGATVSVTDNPGVRSRNCYVNDNSTITGLLDIGEDALLGWYDVRVYVGSQDITSGSPQFHIQPMPSPTVTSIEPESATQGETFWLNIMGNGFPLNKKARVYFSGGSGIEPVQGNVDAWNTISALVTIGRDADLGTRDLIVSFDDPQTTAAPFESSFSVKQGSYSDSALLWVGLVAFAGGLVSGALSWIDSGWSRRKTVRTVAASLLAGAAFAAGFQLAGTLQVYHFIAAFLGGAGSDALTNRFIGATDPSKEKRSPDSSGSKA
jgi:hypothetical protein